MGSNKEDFIRRTGGFRLGETEAQFHARVKEIDALEKKMKSGTLGGPDAFEAVQRRLCELKGIDFDSRDDDD